MNELSNERVRRLFSAILLYFGLCLLLSVLWGRQHFFLQIILIVLTCLGVLGSLSRYIRQQNSLLEDAAAGIRDFLAGNRDRRIPCEEEGQPFQLFHEINRLAAILSAQADREQRSAVFLKDTISDISHQLKTPLAALNVYNGILENETADDPEALKFVRLSGEELDRIGLLVQDLLKIARIDAGLVVFEKQEEDLSEIIRTVKDHFAYREEQEEKAILLSGPDSLKLNCSRMWLTEAIDNLVKNALDHTGSSGIIRISWERQHDMTLISVSDNGSGIHPEDIYHIFKRFYRSRYSQDSTGVGLGLPLTRSIIEGHGGSITVESEPGKGAEFTITLPNPSKL